MGTTKDLIYSIESKRDINCVRLSYRVYNRLSDKDQLAFWIEFKETPEDGPTGHDNRIRPIRWEVADMALFIYTRNKKQTSLHNAFRIARKYRRQLWDQFHSKILELNCHSLGLHKENYIAKQFLFHGFKPLAEFRDIKDVDDDHRNSYITSSCTINGVTYIYPKRLSMAGGPTLSANKKSLWYHFEGGVTLPGYTRVWYTNELKHLKRAQDAQRNQHI